MRADEIVQTLYRQNRINSVLSRDEIFRLQFLACAWRESHSKVWKPFIPWANDAHLLRTILRRKFSNGIQVLGGSMRAKKLGACVECLSRIDASFKPDFVETVLLPVGKKTDAVGAGFDGVEMIFELIQRKIFVHILPHQESWLNVESYACDNPKSTEAHHGTRESVSVFFTRQSKQLTGCRDNF